MTAKILLNDEEVGYIGAIHPQFTKLLGVNGRVFVFELAVDAITDRKLPSPYQYRASHRIAVILLLRLKMKCV